MSKLYSNRQIPLQPSSYLPECNLQSTISNLLKYLYVLQFRHESYKLFIVNCYLPYNQIHTTLCIIIDAMIKNYFLQSFYHICCLVSVNSPYYNTATADMANNIQKWHYYTNCQDTVQSIIRLIFYLFIVIINVISENVSSSEFFQFYVP